MLTCQQQADQGDVTPRTAGLMRMKTHNRLSFESELTFAPKLNATSMKMVKERGNEFRAGVYPNVNARLRLQEEQETLFTFKPQVSETSAKICEGLGTTFMARQELHLEKQKKLYEKSKMPFKSGRLTPVVLTKHKNREKTGAKETDTSQVAWVTPTETPTKFDIENGNRENLPPVISRSTSLSTSLPPKSPKPPTAPQTQSSFHLQRLQEGPFANSNVNFALRKNRTQIVRARVPSNTRHSHPPFEGDKNNDLESSSGNTGFTRSKTTLDMTTSPNKAKVPKLAGINVNRIRNAKLIAEKAMKTRKIFSIHGPYPVVRECLRKRGWVEKQYRYMAPHVFKKKSNGGDQSDDSGDSDGSDSDDDNNNDDSDDDFAGNNDENLEDSDSIYGIMSRIVRNATPTFIWTVRRDSIDYKYLRKDTIVNHYARNGSFTTKVGICTNLRNLHWFQDIDPDTFFPRCYKIGIDEEKMGFIDDFRMTAAVAVVRWVVERHADGNLDQEAEEDEEGEKQDEPENTDDKDQTQTEKSKDEEESKDKDDGENEEKESTENKEKDSTEKEKNSTDNKDSNNASDKTTVQSGRRSKAKKRPVVLPSAFLELAVKICDNHLDLKDHEDIDVGVDVQPLMNDSKWDAFLPQYYQLIHDGATIKNSSTYYEECKYLLNRLKARSPQFHLDGLRNVWIVKPGAKSRGRGIMCMDRLEEITKLVSSQVVRKEGKWVVQKYIERPLLIYETKFDIRQWFLVTDWNPLTIWFYEDSYLRFCTHKFTLKNLEQKIHLANNSIQKNYENENVRSRHLPDDNMWSSEEFSTYLKRRGHGDVFREVIYPGMKQAIVCALQCTQDIIDARKNSFELYGADFMITDDFQPWLIEINSSPAMSASSSITEKMCYDVIEDTMKVVLDRKYDKNCDTGKFELICKQQQVFAPPYIGINLHVEGQQIRKPNYVNKQKSVASITPRLTDLSPYTAKAAPKQTSSDTSVSTTSVNQKPSPNQKKAADKSPSQNQSEKMTAAQVEEVKKKYSGDMMLAQHRLRHKKIKEKMEYMREEINELAKLVTPGRVGGDIYSVMLTCPLSTIDGTWGRSCPRCGHVNGVKLSTSSESTACQCSRDSIVTPTPLQLPQHARYIASPEPIPRSSTFIKAYRADAVRISSTSLKEHSKSQFGFPPSRNVKRLGQTIKQTPKNDKIIRTVIRYEEDGTIKPQTCQMTIVSPR
ncbi:tubulin monoglycylase TTLL3-like isoform X3 [Ptychodera flava]